MDGWMDGWLDASKSESIAGWMVGWMHNNTTQWGEGLRDGVSMYGVSSLVADALTLACLRRLNKLVPRLRLNIKLMAEDPKLPMAFEREGATEAEMLAEDFALAENPEQFADTQVGDTKGCDSGSQSASSSLKRKCDEQLLEDRDLEYALELSQQMAPEEKAWLAKLVPQPIDLTMCSESPSPGASPMKSIPTKLGPRKQLILIENHFVEGRPGHFYNVCLSHPAPFL